MSHVQASLCSVTSTLRIACCLCSTPKSSETQATTGTSSGGFLLEPQHNVMQMGGDFANNPNAQQFIDKMVSKHGFDRQQLQEILSQSKRLDYVLRLMDRQAPTTSRPLDQMAPGCATANNLLRRITQKRRRVLESV